MFVHEKMTIQQLSVLFGIDVLHRCKACINCHLNGCDFLLRHCVIDVWLMEFASQLPVNHLDLPYYYLHSVMTEM